MFKKTMIAAAAIALFGAFGPASAATTVGAKVDNAAHKTAVATRSAAHKTAKVTRKAAHKTVQVTRNAAHKTANATRHAVHRVRHDDRDFHATTTREQRVSEARANWERNRRM